MVSRARTPDVERIYLEPEAVVAAVRLGKDGARPRWLSEYRPDEYLDAVQDYDWHYGPVLAAPEIGRRLRTELRDHPPKDGEEWTADRLAPLVRGFGYEDIEALVSGTYELPPPALVRGLAEAIGVPGGQLWDAAVACGRSVRPSWRYVLGDRMWRCVLWSVDILYRSTPSWAWGESFRSGR